MMRGGGQIRSQAGIWLHCSGEVTALQHYITLHYITLHYSITADTGGNKITIITLVSVWPAQSQVSAVIITLQIFTLGRITRLHDM